MNRPQQSISYLPGLDGLRAIAVLAVVVYHANKDWLPGGFLGVEVFFVISGYLITLLLVTESQQHGKIDFRGFWMRRARRLLPAMWTLLLGVTIYCSLFERAELGKLRGDVIAAFIYVFNWFKIWSRASYFDASASRSTATRQRHRRPPGSGPTGRHGRLQIRIDRCQESLGVEVGLARPDEDGKILGHLSRLNRLDADPLERVGKVGQRRCAVEFATVGEPAGPGED